MFSSLFIVENVKKFILKNRTLVRTLQVMSDGLAQVRESTTLLSNQNSSAPTCTKPIVSSRLFIVEH